MLQRLTEREVECCRDGTIRQEPSPAEKMDPSPKALRSNCRSPPCRVDDDDKEKKQTTLSIVH